MAKDLVLCDSWMPRVGAPCVKVAGHAGGHRRLARAGQRGVRCEVVPAVDLTGQRFGRLIVDQVSTRRGSMRRRSVSRYEDYEWYWLCVCDCANVKRIAYRDLTSGRTRSCGCLRNEVAAARLSVIGPAHPSFKTGLNSLGYRNAWVDGKHKLAHRVVMEEMLGRPLLPEETVHHINGNRADNRPENLELWSSRHPKGQRVVDKVAWAIELLKLYAPERLVP